MSGLLALVGGDEFNPGNEEQDRLLVTGQFRQRSLQLTGSVGLAPHMVDHTIQYCI